MICYEVKQHLHWRHKEPQPIQALQVVRANQRDEGGDGCLAAADDLPYTHCGPMTVDGKQAERPFERKDLVAFSNML